jgi:cell division septal protein FtsQ
VSEVESSNGGENEANVSRAPRLGVKLMIVILIGLALVAIYANVQKARRDKIEQVTIIGTSSATPAPKSPEH